MAKNTEELEDNNRNVRRLWKKPWGYNEGINIAFYLLISGFIFEIITDGGGINLLHYPVNFIALAILLILIASLYLFFGENHIVRWLSSVPAAVSSIGLFTFLSLLLGFTTQNDSTAIPIIRKSGISHLTSSYTFAFALLFFLLTLGLVIIRRFNKFSFRNTGFLMNHAGLWVVIAAASFGSGDIYRLNMDVSKDNGFNKIAYDSRNNEFEMPISLKLLNFNIEQYNPNIVLYSRISNKLLLEKGKTLNQAKKGATFRYDQWNITVKEFYAYVYPSEEGVIIKDSLGAVPAALIVAENIKTKKKVTGWISGSSYFFNSQGLDLDDEYSLVMTDPESKKFSSKIEFKTDNNQHGTFNLEVNKPFSINGWKIYQTGYDERMGKWSQISVVELVKDPWLVLVYIGIGMLLAGAAYLFWTGRKAN